MIKLSLEDSVLSVHQVRTCGCSWRNSSTIWRYFFETCLIIFERL